MSDNEPGQSDAAQVADDQEFTTADMLAIHAALRRELGKLPGLVAQADELSETDRATVAQHWTLVGRFLTAHHTGEDEVLWPVLRERRPAARELVDELEADHERFHALQEQGDEIIASWDEASDQTAERVAECAQIAAELAEGLRAHAAREESELLPLIPGAVTAEEWALLPQHAQRAFAPDEMFLVLGMIMEELPPPAQAGMLAGMPEPAQQAWTAFGKEQYRAYADRINAIAQA